MIIITANKITINAVPSALRQYKFPKVMSVMNCIKLLVANFIGILFMDSK
jgi:hypothetical protein